MAEYDPSIIASVADGLYKRAKNIVFSYTAFGVLFGFGLAFAFANGAAPNPISLGVASFLFGLVGFSMGKNKAFSLKVEAQKLLLDLQIEKNTRPEGFGNGG